MKSSSSEGKTAARRPGESAGDVRSRTLRAHEAPAWCTENSYIITGWRPVTHSVARCLGSWTYAHNETVNIFSHLIPATLAVFGNALIYMYLAAFYPGASSMDRVIFHIYITTSMICFGASAAYHTLLCHSKPYKDWWVRVDYVGILVQILGSFISGIYMGFYCEPEMRRLHWSIIGGLSFLTSTIVLSPIDDKRWRLLRLGTFVTTGFSAFAPIIHAATLFPYHQLDQQAGLSFYYLEGIFILSGVFFYAVSAAKGFGTRL